MSERISFLCYSDIHHHQWDNGLTEQDVLALEDEVCELANVLDVDFTLFGGDRFLWRNPISHVRSAADQKIVQHLRKRKYVAVVGNHDRESKNSHSAHSMMHLPALLPGGLRGRLTISSEAGMTLLTDRPGVQLWSCPAGQASLFNAKKWAESGLMDKDKFNICVFHDIMFGAELGLGNRADFGLNSEILDIPEFDIVLGGDNHVHQELKFKNTPAFYIGAPCQHNWGDVGQIRGFLYVILEKGKPPYIEHMPSQAPQFHRVIETLGDKPNLAKTEKVWATEDWSNKIVHILLKGKQSSLAGLDVHRLEHNLREKTNARKITVTADPDIEFHAIIPELQCMQSHEDDWKAYVKSDQLDFQGASPEQVQQLGLETLQEARIHTAIDKKR